MGQSNTIKSIFFVTFASFPLLLVFCGSSATGGEPSYIGMDFSVDTPANLEYMELKGDTEYFIRRGYGEPYLEARANSSASGIGLKQKINLEETPWMSWTWKVDKPLLKIDERTREGHDFPARVFVVASTGPFPWQRIALNYTWGTAAKKGDHWVSPRSKTAHDIIIDDATTPLGQWVTNQRNVREDFMKFFGRDIRKASAIAVMTDGDNTGQTPVAGYRRVVFSAGKEDEKPSDTVGSKE